ncbi:MAG: hypothetical protein KAX78_08265 [Phycisphaerae bacterium]|nr:hypothetical protein [Phycisphaerae bacterium]
MNREIRVLGILLAAALAVGGCKDGRFLRFWPRPPGGKEDGGHTILLEVVKGENHVATAKTRKALTVQQTNWKDIFLVHKSGQSQICWGTYRSVSAAQKNLKKAKAYRTSDGRAFFARAIVIPVPGKKIGPPEWDLTNATGAHSLLVAAFHEVPAEKAIGRKKCAVDYCRWLRDRGYEAYYYHGLGNSTVTIGAFPASSIKDGTSGEKLIADPKIISLMEVFPHLAVNGYAVTRKVYNPQTRKYKSVKRKTYLVRIPRRKPGDEGALYDSTGHSQPR